MGLGKNGIHPVSPNYVKLKANVSTREADCLLSSACCLTCCNHFEQWPASTVVLGPAAQREMILSSTGETLTATLLHNTLLKYHTHRLLIPVLLGVVLGSKRMHILYWRYVFKLNIR